MPIAIADEEYTHFRNIVKLKTSAYGELDSIPKMCEEQLQRLQSANCTEQSLILCKPQIWLQNDNII